jgi:membrane-associated phospholipid phosphatase
MSNIKDLWYDWLGLNTFLFKKINSLSDLPAYGPLMKTVTIFGDRHMLPLFLSAIAIFAFTSIVMRIVLDKGGTRNYLFIWITITLMLSSGLFAGLKTIDYLKSATDYPRPYVALAKGEVRQLEERPVEDAYRSFPSGHAALITILVFSLWAVLNETFRWIGVLLVFAVSWSRIALGVHFPMDVISGFAIALIIMMIIRYVLYGIMRTIRLALKI